jgi:hypothetical protein
MLSDEDKKVFIDLGMRHNLHGRLGGRARAQTAKRDYHGRFIAEPSGIAIAVARHNVKIASERNRAWAVKRLKEEIGKARSQNVINTSKI